MMVYIGLGNDNVYGVYDAPQHYTVGLAVGQELGEALLTTFDLHRRLVELATQVGRNTPTGTAADDLRTELKKVLTNGGLLNATRKKTAKKS